MKNIVNRMEEGLTFSNYSFDIDAICEYCKIKHDNTTTDKKNNEFRQKEISNSYQLNDEQEMVLAEKIVHEVITPQETPIYDDLKVDIIKGLIQTILEDKLVNSEGLPSLSIPGLLSLQTFANKGFLKINKK